MLHAPIDPKKGVFSIDIYTSECHCPFPWHKINRERDHIDYDINNIHARADTTEQDGSKEREHIQTA